MKYAPVVVLVVPMLCVCFWPQQADAQFRGLPNRTWSQLPHSAGSNIPYSHVPKSQYAGPVSVASGDHVYIHKDWLGKHRDCLARLVYMQVPDAEIQKDIHKKLSAMTITMQVEWLAAFLEGASRKKPIESRVVPPAAETDPPPPAP